MNLQNGIGIGLVTLGLIGACGSNGGGGAGSGGAGATGGTGGAGASGGAGGAGTGTGGMGDPNVLVGTFNVRLVAPVPATATMAAVPGSTEVVGKVYDGAQPSQLIWKQDMADGACKLVTPKVPFCNTPCGGSAACVDDDRCQPYPTAHSVGSVTLKGARTEAGASEVMLSPVSNAYQVPAASRLAYPAFSEGDDLQLDAAGGDFSAFSIKAKGIAPLQVADAELRLEPGQPLTISWTRPNASAASKIHLKLDISHHGGTKGMIECDAEDTGSLVLSAAMLTRLTGLGIAGFPTVILSRRSVGSATIAPGRVDLTVTSDVEKSVTIPGLTSCTSDTDCPTGKTCQNDLTCK